MKNKTLFCFTVSIFIYGFIYAQRNDTLFLKEINVSSYLGNRPYLRTPSSVSVIGISQIAEHSETTMLPVMNAVPGVRMEERSPASYRLSIRGSLLRSPFGIRNVKIYVDEFPFTDAGGNTYLNLLDINLIHRMEILKGPDGSLFGANSGGVIRIMPYDNTTDSTRVERSAKYGSFKLFQQNAIIEIPVKHKNYISLSEGTIYQKGYRKNSMMQRQYFQLADKFDYSLKGQLRAFVFYSNLKYFTPGGLTLSQYENNPQEARPATTTLPGTEEQQSSISNRTVYGGLLNEYSLNKHLKNVTAVFGSHTVFANPFITNYEIRQENSMGFRSWMEAANNKEGEINLIFNIGIEAQQTQSGIANYGNRNGDIDSIQVSDKLKAENSFLFGRASADFYNRITTEISASINNNSYLFSGIYPVITAENKRNFKQVIMPRFAVSYLLSQNAAIRATVSKGYSPPTLAEIRSSDNVINTALEAEEGWNYETGFRIRSKNQNFLWDVSVFQYKLDKAIVRKTDEGENEFFINAGGTRQYGFESDFSINIIPHRNKGFIRYLRVGNSFTFSDFTFSNYTNLENNYNGNALTGVPEKVVVSQLDFEFPLHFTIAAQHNYTGKIPLNDANNVYADNYRLVDVKAGWSYNFYPYILKFNVGVENLLNEKYSLGNDLNAVGGRYYNAAPERSYYVSVSFIWGSP